MPKAHVVYQALEGAVKGGHRNIVTTEDGEYWRAVRQGTAQCFSMSNMKKVRHNSSAGTSSWHVLIIIFQSQSCSRGSPSCFCRLLVGTGIAHGTT